MAQPPARPPRGWVTRRKNGIYLTEAQWASIGDQVKIMGRTEKPTKTDKFIAPIVISGCARTYDIEDDVVWNTYEAAFPHPLKTYQTRFENKDLVKNKVASFQPTACAVGKDVVFGVRLRRNAINAYGDYIFNEENRPRAPEGFTGNGATGLCRYKKAGPGKYQNQTEFARSWQEAMSFFHYFIHCNPYWPTKKAAFDAAILFHDEWANPGRDPDTLKYIRGANGKYERPSRTMAQMKALMFAEGVLTWIEKKMQKTHDTCISQLRTGPTGKKVFKKEQEANALKLLHFALKEYDPEGNSTQFLPKVRDSLDSISCFIDWLDCEETAQDADDLFGWVRDMELSHEAAAIEKQVQDAEKERLDQLKAQQEEREEEERQKREAEQELEKKRREKEAEEKRQRLEKEAEEKRKAAELERQRLEKEEVERQKALELMRYEAKLEMERLAKEQEEKALAEQKKLEEELSQKEKDWFSRWQPDGNKQPSKHLVVRKAQLMECAKWAEKKLEEPSWASKHVPCENDEHAKAFQRKHKQTGANYLKQPTGRVNSLLKSHVRHEVLGHDPERFEDWGNIWAEYQRKQKELEIENRDDRKAIEPHLTVWDEHPPGKRSFYVKKHPDQERCERYQESLDVDPNKKPPSKWCHQMNLVFMAIRDLVESVALERDRIYDPPAFWNPKVKVGSGNCVTSPAYMVGLKCGFFRPEWDDENDQYEKCEQSLKHWLLPTLLPTFSAYLTAFFELCSQPDPKVKLHIWEFVSEEKRFYTKSKIDSETESAADSDSDSETYTKRILSTSYRYVVVHNVSRELFDEYADLLILKKTYIKRESVEPMSTETPTLDDIEKRSSEWVAKTPKTYFDFRHTFRPDDSQKNWEFHPSKWLDEKETEFENGYMDPKGPKGLTESAKLREKEAEKEAKERQDKGKRERPDLLFGDDLVQSVRKRQRVTVDVVPAASANVSRGVTGQGQG